MMTADERESLSPPVVVADVARRLDRLLAQRLPRLEQFRTELHAHARDWSGASLERALTAHLAALAALDFGLLVGPGLRAGPLERHEAAFRRQVAAVADCTEATWGAVKDFVERGARETVTAEGLVSDFVMEVRALQRQADGSRHALRRGSGTGTDPLQQRLAGVEDLCASSHRVQSTTYQIRDERAALVSSLKQLAQGLGGGLLDRLRPLVGPGLNPATDGLERGATERQRLQLALQDALAHLHRLQTRYAGLAAVLQATGEKTRRLG